MAVTSGTIYRFTNAQFPAKALNVYASGTTISARRNVCLYDDTPSDVMQQWVLQGAEDSGYFLCSKANQNYILRCSDAFDANSYVKNADVKYIGDLGSEDFLIDFVYLGNNKVMIKRHYTGEYLTASTNQNGNTNSIETLQDLKEGGNVYWADLSSSLGNKQVWNVSPSIDEDTTTEESDYPTGYYRFSNGGYYLTGTTNSVTAAAVNGLTTQTWNFRNNKLYTESSSSYGVAGTSSATMSTSPNEVVLVWAGTNKCYIKLSGSNKYLQRSSATVSWGTSPAEWTIEEIIKKTGVPYMGTEYFSRNAGLSNGTWNTSYSNIVRNFYKKVYDVDTVSDANCFYNLYGALMYNAGSDTGKFHCGVDMKLYHGAPIKAPFSGKVTRIDENYGRVYLYNETLNATFIFLHMDISKDISKNDIISEGTIIGTQSGYGSTPSPTDFSSHLHVEIHAGEHSSGASIAPAYSYDQLGNSLEPYEYLGEV